MPKTRKTWLSRSWAKAMYEVIYTGQFKKSYLNPTATFRNFFSNYLEVSIFLFSLQSNDMIWQKTTWNEIKSLTISGWLRVYFPRAARFISMTPVLEAIGMRILIGIYCFCQQIRYNDFLLTSQWTLMFFKRFLSSHKHQNNLVYIKVLSISL